MSSVLGTYARKDISFSEGKGSYLYAENGDKYLDFVQGIATNILGHCHKHLEAFASPQENHLKEDKWFHLGLCGYLLPCQQHHQKHPILMLDQ